ncbi:MAG: antibiotic biosynthesis monooxygenase [Amylibacter sp.]|nr:antibiotic biosynthesis monooxygenase [Amylibacter sp.]
MDIPLDRMENVTKAVVDHINLTRAEAGCISFEVTPCPDVSGRFLVNEIFTNQAAFDHHQTRTKASPWAEATAGLPRDYTITKGP